MRRPLAANLTILASSSLVLSLAVLGCGSGEQGRPSTDEDAGDWDAGNVDAGSVDAGTVDPGGRCFAPLPHASSDIVLAAPFDSLYCAYDLGQIPGGDSSLTISGITVLPSDQNTLLFAKGFQRSEGAIYSIRVTRDSGGHITGFSGTPSLRASTPLIMSNLVWASSDLLLYPMWNYQIDQISGGASAPSRETALRTIGWSWSDAPAGLGLVPPGLTASGELRIISFRESRWCHVGASPDGSLLAINSVTQTETLPGYSMGFAYVPAGSPGFPVQSLINAEFHDDGGDHHDASQDRVVVYEVGQDGDPILGTRREFFSRFPWPLGAYFDSVTGDFLFTTEGCSAGNNRLIVVRGFVPPPVWVPT